MKNNRIIYLLLVTLLLATVSCKAQKQKPIPVIFETDMGNDVDDGLALAMLFRYANQGKIDFLGISNNKQSLSSLQFLDVMKRSYCYGKLPLGTVQKGEEGENESNSFAPKVMNHRENGQLIYASEISNYNEIEGSVDMYRRLLSKAKDTSVAIISVGFSTNIAALLQSGADQYSALSGKDLIAKKVKYLSVMGGNFQTPKKKEFNIKTDIPAAKTVFSSWPTKIYISPFEVGASIKFPASAIEKNLDYSGKNPLVTAYEKYIKMPYDRQTWDLTSVLYAVEPSANYFRLSQAGMMKVDEEGFTTFETQPGGKHFYFLTPTPEEREKVKSRFVELVMAEKANQELCK